MRARIVHGAVLAALTATGVAWVSLDKSVTVEIDGQSRVVSTHASTVGEVLDRAGVRVDAHDVLTPAGSTQVKSGSRIIIRRGRLVTVRVNDIERGVWVNASDVDQVLAEIGIQADDRTYVSASRSSRVPSTGDFSLQVRMPSAVQLVIEGRVRTVVTTAPTVAGLLAAERVTLSAYDDVNVPLGSYPAEGTTIVVQDSRGERVARTRPIPFKTVTTVDGTLPVGTTRIKSPGVRGVLVLYFRQQLVGAAGPVTVPDGQRIARVPRDQIVVAGGKRIASTAPKAAAVLEPKPVPPPRPPVVRKPAPRPAVPKPAVPDPGLTTKPVISHKPAADNLNWRALAMCESGGNSRAVSPGGIYRGLYQFMRSTWRGVGGAGDPVDASRDEQTYRAQILYRRVGASAWGRCGSMLFR